MNEEIEQIYEQAYGEGEEPEPAESPAAVESTGQEAEPVAEGENGVEQPGTEDVVSESTLPENVPYDRFKEVVGEKNTLKTQKEAYERLFADPRVSAVVQQITGQVQDAPETKTAEQKILSRLDSIDPEDLTENELALYETLKEARELIGQTKSSVETFEQRTQREQMESTQMVFDTALTEVAESGAPSDEQKAEILHTAAALENAALAMGRKPDLSDCVKKAYRAVMPAVSAEDTAKQQAELARLAKLQAEKQRLAGGRTAGTGGPSGKAAPQKMTPEEAAEAAYLKVYGS